MSASLATWQPEITSGAEPKLNGILAPPTKETARAQEAELIARSRTGDVEAFGVLYDHFESVVFRHALHVLGHADDADDVRQETFVRAFRSLHGFRGDASLKTYLLVICSNLCRDRLRTKLRRPEQGYGISVPETSSGDASADPFTHLQRAVQADRVRCALQMLPAPAREILVLRHVEELEFDEIAQILGCSRVSVPVRLFRARRQFKTVYLSLVPADEGIPSC